MTVSSTDDGGTNFATILTDKDKKSYFTSMTLKPKEPEHIFSAQDESGNTVIVPTLSKDAHLTIQTNTNSTLNGDDELFEINLITLTSDDFIDFDYVIETRFDDGGAIDYFTRSNNILVYTDGDKIKKTFGSIEPEPEPEPDT